jgi:thioesterase domain-containing protein
VNHTTQNAELATALKTLEELTHSGIELWREGDRLHYGATEGALTADTLQWLGKNKTLLLKLLSRGNPAPGTSVDRNIVILGRGNLDHHVACVHAIDGSASCYFDLARELTRDGIGTYGIHALDLQQKKGTPTTLAAIGSEYADQLIRVKPSGPFFLVGWCSGALIAFEIARELIRRGREVGRLILLDPTLARFDSKGRALFELQEAPRSVPPTGLPSRPRDADGQLWWKFLSLISAAVAAGDAYPLDPAFWNMDDNAKSEYLFANRRNEQLINLSCMLNQAKTPEDVLYIFKLVRNQAIALARYRPAFLQISVSLFVSADQFSYTQAQIASRAAARESMWKNLSAGLDIYTRVPGGHMALVGRPCIEFVARHIAASIWPRT